MKLLRATCVCGFQTRKVRSGYRYDRWWFPVIDTTTGELTDMQLKLSQKQADLLVKNSLTADQCVRPFLEFVTRDPRSPVVQEPGRLFNPAIGTAVECPKCCQETLVLGQVFVRAICNRECGHRYEWYDSGQGGCPLCEESPMRFQTDLPDGGVTSECRCSQMESASHTDAYCPACGELPEEYTFDGRTFCGKHHVALIPCRTPGNYMFICPPGRESRWFPNAKHHGDAAPDDASALSSMYCAECESEYQRWREVERLTDALRVEHSP